MFVIHFKDGNTITEKEKDWNDIPDKENITSIQVVHTNEEILQVLLQDAKQLVSVVSTEQKGSADAYLKHIKTIWDEYKTRYEIELNTLEKVVIGDTPEVNQLRDKVKRVKYWLKFLRDVEKKNFQLNDCHKHCATLTGSKTIPYRFFQFKEARDNVCFKEIKNNNKDSDVFASPFIILSQTIGKVGKEGKVTCAEMDFLTGWVKIYDTTMHNLQSNNKVVIDAFPYIKEFIGGEK